MPAKLSLGERAERLVYRVAGLPVAVRALFPSNAALDTIDRAFTNRYWRPQDGGEWAELFLGLLVWPIAVPLAIAWYAVRNGRIIAKREGRPVAAQLSDQLRLYFSSGVLPPWYYIFSLHRPGGTARARTFLQRHETKRGALLYLKRRGGSPLQNKVSFARYCAEHGLPCIPVIAEIIPGDDVPVELPDADLFIKPTKGRGGRGAERWDLVSPQCFRSRSGERLSGAELVARLKRNAPEPSLTVQQRVDAHPELAVISPGALPTVRVVTCLNEVGEPEVVAAVFRMAVRPNVSVDNMHAGGLGAGVDLEAGTLTRASNLGSDARVGWHSSHPATGARIEGFVLPFWDDLKDLAVFAHRAFGDRAVIGWDIAILENGPILVEGNGNPDFDIIQRFMPNGLRPQRLGELIAYHLQRVGLDITNPAPSPTGASAARPASKADNSWPSNRSGTAR